MKPRIFFDKNACIISERLILKGITAKDAQVLTLWRSQKDIYMVSDQVKPISLAEHANWYNHVYLNNPQELRLIIHEPESGKDIGMVGGLYKQPAFVLSYYIGDNAFRNKGYATEAIAALIQYISAMGVHRFEAYIKPDNASSIACIKKLQFHESKNQNSNGYLLFYLETEQ